MGTQATNAAPARQAVRVAKQERVRQLQQHKPAPQTPSVCAGVETVLQGSGQPLDPKLRTTMERRIHHDFSNVRVHSDNRAASSAQALNAKAYAVGQHLVFDSGEYRPTSAAGVQLLAHELVHVAQQGAAPYRPELGLTLSSTASPNEREADQASQRMSLGESVRVRRAADAGTVQRLQRAEHGTYVSKVGLNPYLDAGEQFYKTWSHPNVKRVSNMKDVLDDLDKAKDPIEKFRIVSHGSSVGLELGLLPEIDPDYFTASTSGEFTTEARFRKQFTNNRLVQETVFATIYAALWKDTTTQALLTTLGGTKDVPGEGSNLGIVLRSILDAHWLDKVELDTGGAPTIPNLAALRTFISLRRSTYGKLIIEAAPKDQQPDLRKAIAELAKQLPGIITAANITFSPKITKDEAKTLADPFVESPGKPSGLKKELSKSIEEGAGGPYLKTLKSVRAKINTKTHIEIRGCNVGSNTTTMDTLRGFFASPGALPSMTAPDLYQYFFQLNVKAYGSAEQADLEAAFGNADLGMPEGYQDITRLKAGEMTRVVKETTLPELASKYGFSAAKVRKLNPEIEDPDKLKTGDIVWLVPRTEVQAGIYKTLQEFCEEYVGNPYSWPKVWAANPWLGDPKKLKPDDKMKVPADVLKPPIAAAARTAKEFAAAVRGGEAASGLASKLESKVRTKRGVRTVTTEFEHPRPVLHIDDAKRNEALGKWLASQKFDPKGRTAEVLSKRFGKTGKEFEAGRKGTYVQFLSWDYPNAKDPIFPEDPRYDKHIIRRP